MSETENNPKKFLMCSTESVSPWRRFIIINILFLLLIYWSSGLFSDDLDEMATVSEKMHTFAGLSRSKAVKVQAKEMQIIQVGNFSFYEKISDKTNSQVTNKQFYIKICTENGDFSIDIINQSEMSKKMKRCEILEEKVTYKNNICWYLQHIVNQLLRFSLWVNE